MMKRRVNIKNVLHQQEACPSHQDGNQNLPQGEWEHSSLGSSDEDKMKEDHTIPLVKKIDVMKGPGPEEYNIHATKTLILPAY